MAHDLFTKDGITVLDPSMKRNEIRLLAKGLEEVIGFKITNKTGKHLFIEVKPNMWRPLELVIRHEPD